MTCDCNCDYWFKEILKIQDRISQEWLKHNEDINYEFIKEQTKVLNRFFLHLLGNILLHIEDPKHYPYEVEQECNCEDLTEK